MKIYLVVNDGDVVYASLDRDYVLNKADGLNQKEVDEEIEACGRDAEDLTDREYAEMAFMAGYNSCYCCTEVAVEVDDTEELKYKDTVVEDCEGNEYTYDAIYEALDETEKQTEFGAINFDCGR